MTRCSPSVRLGFSPHFRTLVQSPWRAYINKTCRLDERLYCCLLSFAQFLILLIRFLFALFTLFCSVFSLFGTTELRLRPRPQSIWLRLQSTVITSSLHESFMPSAVVLNV